MLFCLFALAVLTVSTVVRRTVFAGRLEKLLRFSLLGSRLVRALLIGAGGERIIPAFPLVHIVNGLFRSSQLMSCIFLNLSAISLASSFARRMDSRPSGLAK